MSLSNKDRGSLLLDVFLVPRSWHGLGTPSLLFFTYVIHDIGAGSTLGVETLPSAWEFFIGLLRFQQSFVIVSHLHLEKKDVESLGRQQCPSPRTTGEPTPGRTDPDVVNDLSEKEQRRRAKAVPGSGHQEHINIHKVWENVFQEHQTLKEKELEMGPKASHGYGGKFGVEQDRMDKDEDLWLLLGFPGGARGKEPSNAGGTRDSGSVPGTGRSLGGGKSKPLQNSCLENPMNRGT